MSTKYYYLVAALPYVTFDQENPVDIDGFLQFCRRMMKTHDYELVLHAQLDDFPSPPRQNQTLNQWQNWEKALRNELVKLRAGQIGIDPVEFLAPAQELLEVRDIAREAFNQDSPLQAEMILMKERWSFLESLELDHFFDVETILLYFLKLQIVARKGRFAEDEGKEKFEKIYRNIIEGDASSKEEGTVSTV